MKKENEDLQGKSIIMTEKEIEEVNIEANHIPVQEYLLLLKEEDNILRLFQKEAIQKRKKVFQIHAHYFQKKKLKFQILQIKIQYK